MNVTGKVNGKDIDNKEFIDNMVPRVHRLSKYLHLVQGPSSWRVRAIIDSMIKYCDAFEFNRINIIKYSEIDCLVSKGVNERLNELEAILKKEDEKANSKERVCECETPEPYPKINKAKLLSLLHTNSGEHLVLQVDAEALKLKVHRLEKDIRATQKDTKSANSKGNSAHTKIDQLLKRVEDLEQYREGEVAEFGDNEYVEDKDGRMVKKKWFEKTNVKHDFDDDVLTNGKRCIHIGELRKILEEKSAKIEALQTSDKKLKHQNAQLFTKLDLLTKRVDGLDERFEPAREDDDYGYVCRETESENPSPRTFEEFKDDVCNKPDHNDLQFMIIEGIRYEADNCNKMAHAFDATTNERIHEHEFSLLDCEPLFEETLELLVEWVNHKGGIKA